MAPTRHLPIVVTVTCSSLQETRQRGKGRVSATLVRPSVDIRASTARATTPIGSV